MTKRFLKVVLLVSLVLSVLLIVGFDGFVPQTVKASPSYEDFTSFTEGGADADGILTQTSTRSTWTSMVRDCEVYLSKSYGSGHFDDFEHLFDFQFTAVEAGDADSRDILRAIYMLAKTSGWDADNRVRLYAIQNGIGDDTFKLIFQHSAGGVSQFSYGSIFLSAGTTYYVTFSKSGSTYRCRIYSDSGRTSLVADSGDQSGSDITYEYITVPHSANFASDPDDDSSGYVENLDVQEEAEEGPTINQLRLSTTTSDTNITSISVNIHYEWEANITDEDGISDIENLTIRIADNPANTINEDTPSFTEASEYWFLYDNSTGSEDWEWHNGSAWSTTETYLNISGCIAPSGTSGWFKFQARLSKIASHSATWQFAALVYDSSDSDTASFNSITIAFYTELSVESTHTFGDLAPGSVNQTLAEGSYSVSDGFVDESKVSASDGVYVNTTDGHARLTLSDTAIQQWNYTSGYAMAQGYPIGDTDNDGLNELFFEDNRTLVIYKWNGTDYELNYTIPTLFGTERLTGYVCGDTDGDGDNEVVISWYHGNMTVYDWNGTDYDKTFQDEIADLYLMYDVNIGECNNDTAYNEIILCTNPSAEAIAEIIIYTYNGATYIENGTYNISGLKATKMSAIGDVNNDGENEIVFSANDYNIYIIKWNGTDYDYVDSYNPASQSMYGVSLQDATEDGTLEIYSSNYAYSYNATVWLHQWNGSAFEEIEEVEFANERYTIEGVCSGNLDDDNDIELVATTNSSVHILFWNGTALEEESYSPLQPFQDNDYTAIAMIGDTDNDDINELVVNDLGNAGNNLGDIWVYQLEFESTGVLYSTNLLSGESVSSITQFNYTATIPAQTTLHVLFSQDNSTWKNSTDGTAWQVLSEGTNNTISLTSLSWSGANFYYRIGFNNTDDSTPYLNYTAITYTQHGSIVTITIITNAPVDLQAKGDGDLTYNGYTIPLGNVRIHNSTLENSIVLTTSYQNIPDLTNLSAGESEHTVVLWITVPNGTEDGDYSYTLTIKCVEHT